MSVPLDVVSTISRAVASEQGPLVEIVTIASSDGEAGRVELLIAVGDRPELDRFMLNLDRHTPAIFELQLRAALKQALAPYQSRHG